MVDKVHTTAQDGFKEGSFYDQNRPSYADELVTHVFENLYQGHSDGVKYHILELGAGTGKFTKKILEKLDKRCRYLATDPSESFLSVLKDNIPEVETAVCAAVDIPLPDNSVQNIIGAQCFHWFDNVESLTEMARVLVPEGRIILVWNTKDWDVDWMMEMEGVLKGYYYESTPRDFAKKWKPVIETFPSLARVEHTFLPEVPSFRGNKDFIVDHFLSISFVAKLGAMEKEKARAKFRAVLDNYFGPDEGIQMPLVSEFYCAKKSV